MAEALAEAHLKNVVHGDIKPSNLMLTSRGHVKVMDFGIAKRTPRNGEVTTTYGVIPPGVTVGTPVYMAPEQLLGHAADSKSDIFASGIVVYELVSGVHPFRRSTVEATIAAILHENHQPLASVVQDLPDGLSTVVDRMLEKSREARYASMEAVWLDLRQIDHQRKTAQQHRSPGAESAVEIAIAVLPFRDLSSGKDQEYFCDGLVEELISALTQVDGIRVAPRTSVFRFKEASLDLREIAAQLNVPIVLEGSVRKSGQQLRVIVNLVDAVANHSLWSEKYEAKLSGVFKIQDAIVRTVTEKLQATLLPAKAPRLTAGALPAVRFDAYEEYLHGRFCWNKRTESGLHQSVRHFDNAIAAQPDYVAALAGLADSYCALGLYGALSPENAMPKARNTAHRVLALDTSSSIARTTLACVAAIFDWDWAEAEKQFKLGIDSDPKYALAHHWYANNLLIPLERFDEARFEAQAAQALEPESPAIALTSGLVSYFEQRYLQAIEEFLHAAEIDPGFGMTYYFLGQAYLQAERPALALEVLQTANTLTGGSPEVLSMLGYAHAVSGNTTEASALLEELIRRAASRYISPVLVAQLLIGLDQLEDAVAYISQAQRVHAADLIWLRIRPQFSKLRTDVRFISVCEKLAI
jgi:serine/threonine-protein kinase